MKNNLKELRESKGLSQQKLGDVLGVSRQTINSVENGKFDPSLTLAIKLTRFFDKPIDSIFEHKGLKMTKKKRIERSFIFNSNYLNSYDV